MLKHARTIGSFFFFLAIANFVAFGIGTLVIGGDALSEKIEGGRYYVGNHGRLTEVSRETWMYSKIHTYSMFTTHLVGLVVSSGLLTYAEKKSRK